MVIEIHTFSFKKNAFENVVYEMAALFLRLSVLMLVIGSPNWRHNDKNVSSGYEVSRLRGPFLASWLAQLIIDASK